MVSHDGQPAAKLLDPHPLLVALIQHVGHGAGRVIRGQRCGPRWRFCVCCRRIHRHRRLCRRLRLRCSLGIRDRGLGCRIGGRSCLRPLIRTRGFGGGLTGIVVVVRRLPIWWRTVLGQLRPGRLRSQPHETQDQQCHGDRRQSDNPHAPRFRSVCRPVFGKLAVRGRSPNPQFRQPRLPCGLLL